MNNKETTNRFWRIFAIAALTAFCVIGILNVCSNRYRPFHSGPLVLDSWTGKVYDVEGNLFKIPK